MCYHCLEYKRGRERKTPREKLIYKGYRYCPWCGKRINKNKDGVNLDRYGNIKEVKNVSGNITA